MKPQNDILILEKNEITNTTPSGFILPTESSDSPVQEYRVLYKNDGYGYEVGDVLLLAKGKTVMSRKNGVDLYFAKACDVWAIVE